jgi:hypothetical protein
MRNFKLQFKTRLNDSLLYYFHYSKNSHVACKFLKITGEEIIPRTPNDQKKKNFFFNSTGVWTPGLMLARQALYYLSHDTSPMTKYNREFFFFLTKKSLFCGNRIWTQGFAFAKQVLYHLSHFAQVILEMESICLDWLKPWSSQTQLPK